MDKKSSVSINREQLTNNFAGRYLARNGGIMLAIILLCVIMSFLNQFFFTANNFTNVLRQITINMLLAYGMTCTLLVGGIDLTVGSVTAASGCILVMLVLAGVPFILAMLVALGFGVLVGVINGYLINRINLPPFIVTLVMQKIVRGVGFVVINGSPVQLINDNFKFIGSASIAFIPVPVWIVILITIGLIITLNNTKFGRHVYAMGGNIDAARFSGVNVHRTRIIVYMISGFCAAMAGIILAARMYSGQPELAVGYESDAIAAAVLGGVRFTGGIGTIGGVILGSLLIGIVNNGMNLLGFPAYIQSMVQGFIILIAITYDSFRRRL